METRKLADQISEVLGIDLSPELKVEKILESCKDIELDEYEMNEAIAVAKLRKKGRVEAERLRRIEEENRRRKKEKFDFMAASTWYGNRAANLFKGKFVLDYNNETIFEMMCYYFNNDLTFETIASAYGVKNPSLEKGILFAGNFGTGKSWFMKLFMQNKRQSFFIRDAKKIAEDFLKSKDKVIPEEYVEPFENGFEDPNVFYQKYSGLCIDDIGAENVKNNFGNVSNVIGDLIEQRYSYNPAEGKPKLIGPMLHGVTNLSADELKNYYGERVTSRMREIFNFIYFEGKDRRK